MTDQYETMRSFIQTYIDDHHEFLSWLGVRVESVSEGSITFSIPYDEKLTNTRPDAPERRAEMQGGVAATLIDTAGGMALRTVMDDPINMDSATINLNVNYLRPALDDLTATAEVVRLGSSVGVTDVIVESETPDGETKAVASGQGAFRIFGPE